MSRSAAQRSMVRALRYRVLAVVATAMAVMGVASVWGLKIVTDRNAEHQVRVVAQTVMTWGVEDGGVRVVDSTELTSVDAGSTVVALLNADDRVVVATSMLSVTVSDLQVIASRLENRGTLRSDVGSRTILFTEVPLAGEVALADGTRTPVVRALVGVGVEASDKLVSALALAALGMLLIAVATVAVVTTAVVARTTRALTDLTGRVEHGQLEGLDESPAVEFAETGAIASAIMRLDRPRLRSGERTARSDSRALPEAGTPATRQRSDRR